MVVVLSLKSCVGKKDEYNFRHQANRARKSSVAYSAISCVPLRNAPAWSYISFSLCHFVPSEKTKNLLFNGTKAVMGTLWKVDGDEKACNGHALEENPTPNGNHALLKGQTVISFDGKLKRTSAASGNPYQYWAVYKKI